MPLHTRKTNRARHYRVTAFDALLTVVASTQVFEDGQTPYRTAQVGNLCGYVTVDRWQVASLLRNARNNQYSTVTRTV